MRDLLNKWEAEAKLDSSSPKPQRILALIALVRKKDEALKYYANPLHSGQNLKKGTRVEYGCGCCAGIIEEDNGSVDYDRSVQGLTAQEALALTESLK